jgi:hypothetical protein
VHAEIDGVLAVQVLAQARDDIRLDVSHGVLAHLEPDDVNEALLDDPVEASPFLPKPGLLQLRGDRPHNLVQAAHIR